MNRKDIRLRKMEALILHTFSIKAIEANDERIKMVIFTRISISQDFRNVKVFFREIKGEGKEETLKALNNAKGYFKTALKENSFFRFIPEISFCYDNF